MIKRFLTTVVVLVGILLPSTSVQAIDVEPCAPTTRKISLEYVHTALGIGTTPQSTAVPMFQNKPVYELVTLIRNLEAKAAISGTDGVAILAAIVGGKGDKLAARIAVQNAADKSIISRADEQQLLLRITTGGMDPPVSTSRTERAGELVTVRFAEVLSKWDELDFNMQLLTLKEMLTQRREILRDLKAEEAIEVSSSHVSSTN